MVQSSRFLNEPGSAPAYAGVRAVAGSVDAVVVVGSASSANTAALVQVAERAGCHLVVRVDGAADLPAGVVLGTAGVTAGASAPESAVEEVIAALGGRVEQAVAVEEDEYFPPPSALRRLLADDPAFGSLLARDRQLSPDDFLSIVEAAVAARAA